MQKSKLTKLTASDIKIGLNLIPGIGSILSKRILQRFPTYDELVNASFEELGSIKGLRKEVVRLTKEFSWELEIQKEKKRAALLGVNILTEELPGYPEQLLTLYDPPSVLYVRGSIPINTTLNISIVGSRMPSTYGKIMAKRFAKELSESGITIISGFARGIDSICHRTVLESGGRTIAVLGTGIDMIYPPENRDLYGMLVEKGALVSEFPIGTRPDRTNFPRRNRVISGLSDGVLVIEAGEKSGSLITADFALDQGREVFALPGNISSKSKGTNGLIKKGAILVENGQELISEMSSRFRSALPDKIYVKNKILHPLLSIEEEKVYTAMEYDQEVHIDTLIEKTKLPPGMVSGILLKLELLGIAIQVEGKHYIKTRIQR